MNARKPNSSVCKIWLTDHTGNCSRAVVLHSTFASIPHASSGIFGRILGDSVRWKHGLIA
eukprot:5923489-Amphidinium_carterae.2